MKICFVCMTPLKTEIQGHLAVLDACLLAKSLGDESQIYFLYCGKADLKLLKESNIKPVRYNDCDWNIYEFIENIFRYCCLIWTIIRKGKKWNIDIYTNVWRHHFLFPVILGAKICNSMVLARVVGVTIGRMSNFRSNGLKRLKGKMRLRIEKLSLKKACGIATISEYLKTLLIERGIDGKRIFVISTGVDVNKFIPVKPKENNREIRLVYVGRLVRNKGVHVILKAVKLLKYRGKNAKLWIIGEGFEKESLREMAVALGIEESVVFHGRERNDKLPKLYAKCDIGVFVTVNSEGLGKGVLEAKSCGLPVIVSNVGSLPSLLEDGAGIIVPPDDSNSLCDAICKLCNSSELREKYGKIGRKFVVENHSLEVVRQKYISLFKMLIKDKKKIVLLNR